MNLKEKSLATAIRLALASAMLTSMAAYAEDGNTEQAPESEEVEKLEKIQVTGSRLRGIDTTGSSPLQVISRRILLRSRLTPGK